MTKEKIIKKEIVKFSFPKNPNIIIGDPMYLEDIENGTDTGCEKDLVFIGKIPQGRKGAISIKEVHIDEDCEWSEDGMYHFNCIEVAIHFAEEEKLKTYLHDKWYGENSVKKTIELGCDTAQFEFSVNDKYINFRTGADGYYGTVRQCKQYYGTSIFLSLDGDWFEFDDVKKRLEYLFCAD